ncbi:MAG: glucose-6-phosphate dehydrogenase [Deltaproteobacteria bacterium]|nr:glucose-6-phosphate dehydrogenase [Deltaproteobacteria bacterium]
MENPFRVGLKHVLHVEPCVVVIFGVTGDLAHRKLIPALYNLSVDALLPAHFSLIGFARREFSNETFRTGIHDSVSKFSRRRPLNDSVWNEFSSRSFYVQGAFDDPAAYLNLKKLLDDIDAQSGVLCNRVFYFATAPEYFATIATQLDKAGLLAPRSEKARSRVIIEKPFGNDLPSARALNAELSEVLEEDQIYRIDHYLGKETVQNLLVFRFANGIFEPIWNHKYISHVEISVCESIGVENRAGYFDKAGILRDIVQNHVFQLLSLVALEPPVAFEADAVRDEKVKVLRSVRRFQKGEVGKKVIRGRYQSGTVAGKEVAGYLAENGVDPESTTDTYVALELAIDNWRWAGVPFYLRAGKRLPKRVTDISIFFRNVPYRLFQEEDVSRVVPNVLSFQIQPDEGIALKISAKPPGPQVQVQPVNMNFSYGSSFGIEPPEAYERLLLDCMRGDATLFTRSDEIEQAWDVLAPVIEAWSDRSARALPVFGYDAGTWGPQASEELLVSGTGSGWRRL